MLLCLDLYASLISSLLSDTNKILRATEVLSLSKFSQSSWCDEKSISLRLSFVIFCKSLLLIFLKFNAKVIEY